MKVAIPEDLKGKELYDFLIQNKEQLITQKKSLIKKCDPISSTPTYFHKKGGEAIKTSLADIPADVNSVMVKVVANAAMFCDSQLDVLLPDNWKKSIKDRQGLVPHLHDHIHEIEAEVGDVKRFYSQDINLSDLGMNVPGFTQCLIFETDVIKEYNPRIFDKYKKGKIKQHSIGLMYMKIGMAINDEDYVAEFELWNKYINDIINKDVVEERGYFWVVPEIKLIENSAVLFGSNELTPTLDVKDTSTEPEKPTQEKPLPKAFDFAGALHKTKIII